MVIFKRPDPRLVNAEFSRLWLKPSDDPIWLSICCLDSPHIPLASPLSPRINSKPKTSAHIEFKSWDPFWIQKAQYVGKKVDN